MSHENNADQSFKDLDMCLRMGDAPNSILNDYYKKKSLDKKSKELVDSNTFKYNKHNKNKKKDIVYKELLEKRLTVEVVIDSSKDHNCLFNECKKNGYIYQSSQKNMFYCISSGYIHECCANNNSKENCRYILNGRSSLICYMSGYELGPIYKEENKWNESSTNQISDTGKSDEHLMINKTKKSKKNESNVYETAIINIEDSKNNRIRKKRKVELIDEDITNEDITSLGFKDKEELKRLNRNNNSLKYENGKFKRVYIEDIGTAVHNRTKKKLTNIKQESEETQKPKKPKNKNNINLLLGDSDNTSDSERKYKNRFEEFVNQLYLLKKDTKNKSVKKKFDEEKWKKESSEYILDTIVKKNQKLCGMILLNIYQNCEKKDFFNNDFYGYKDMEKKYIYSHISFMFKLALENNLIKIIISK